jgi:hypothetical protein
LRIIGQSGIVYAGNLEVVVESPTQYLSEVERWRARSGKTLTHRLDPNLKPG